MTPVKFQKDECTQNVTFICWSPVGRVLLDMWWCLYLEGLSTGTWWMDFGDGFQLAQVQCDNYGRVGHPRECCFNLYPELRLGYGGGHGGVAQRGRGGRGGGGGRGTPTVRAPPTATPPLTTEAAMGANIK